MVKQQTFDGVVASSTKIREFVLEGKIDGARMLLGRDYAIEGTPAYRIYVTGDTLLFGSSPPAGSPRRARSSSPAASCTSRCWSTASSSTTSRTPTS